MASLDFQQCEQHWNLFFVRSMALPYLAHSYRDQILKTTSICLNMMNYGNHTASKRVLWILTFQNWNWYACTFFPPHFLHHLHCERTLNDWFFCRFVRLSFSLLIKLYLIWNQSWRINRMWNWKKKEKKSKLKFFKRSRSSTELFQLWSNFWIENKNEFKF